ncbi:TetR/AcrR family transcriptional regulator [Sphingopyxis sp.]|uniref:TetR/AcrR family transcriptional regulator n=1 Tax=Sphingopyxis sp. TaxID=1908224 RepID=UPI003D6D408C
MRNQSGFSENSPLSGNIEDVLDATKACIAHSGFVHTHMGDIAKGASMSRATLYRRFENKEQIFAALLRREAASFVDRARAIAARSESVLSRVEAILFVALAEIAGHDWLAGELSKGPDTRVMAILNPADQEAAGYALLPLLEEGVMAGEVRDSLPLSELVAWIFRQLLSIAAMPLGQADKELRVQVLVMPALRANGSEPADGLTQNLCPGPPAR